MAADSQATDEGTATKQNVTKIHQIGDSLCGFAGTLSECSKALAWLKGKSKKEPKFTDVEILQLRKDGIWVYDECAEPYKVDDEFAAIGSGSQGALVAMHLGYAPKKAVETTSKVDPSTGGRVRQRHLKSVL